MPEHVITRGLGMRLGYNWRTGNEAMPEHVITGGLGMRLCQNML